jgi:hypothetical protein
MKAVEKYYSVTETALLVSCCTKTVRERIQLGELGAVVNIGRPDKPDYRIPASGINTWLEARQVFGKPGNGEPGIAARTAGELRRKAAAAVTA